MTTSPSLVGVLPEESAFIYPTQVAEEIGIAEMSGNC